MYVWGLVDALTEYRDPRTDQSVAQYRGDCLVKKHIDSAVFSAAVRSKIHADDRGAKEPVTATVITVFNNLCPPQ